MCIGEEEANKGVVENKEDEQDKAEACVLDKDEREKEEDEENEEVEEEDDFGDFEEGENDEQREEECTESLDVSTNFKQRNNDQIDELSNDKIDELVDKIFGIELSNEKEASNDFKFNDRSEQLYENLVNTDEYPLQQMIWKQSIILKQLFLNLQIPIVENKFKNRVNSHKKINLKYDTDLKVNTEMQSKILNELSEFRRGFVIDQKSDDFKSILDDTDKQMYEMKKEINDNNLVRLNVIKKELLKTFACWNKQFEIIKEDNDLFTSYVENLVGNTQKLRRFNK